MSLGGAPLLVDVHAGPASNNKRAYAAAAAADAADAGATAPDNEHHRSGSNLGRRAVNETRPTERLSADVTEINAACCSSDDKKHGVKEALLATTSKRKGSRGKMVEAATAERCDDNEAKVPGTSTSIPEEDEDGAERDCDGALDAARLAATASTPLLPCFSMGSRVGSRGPRSGAFPRNDEKMGTNPPHVNNLKVFFVIEVRNKNFSGLELDE